MPDPGRPSAQALTVARALEHPLRADVFFEYERGATSPSRVARELGAPLNLVAYHTRVLLRLGCIELVRVERRGGAREHTYESAVNPVIEDADWALLPARLRRALTRTALDRITVVARRAALAGGFDGELAHLSRVPVRVGRDEARTLSQSLRDLLARARDNDRSDRPAGDEREYELILLFFESDLSPSGTA